MTVVAITDDEGHAAALAEVSRLWDAPDGSPEAERLDVLATLIEAYERRRWPVRRVTPLEILRHTVSDMGRTEAELAEVVGSRALASLLLSGDRPITPSLARRISEAWCLPPSTLTGDGE